MDARTLPRLIAAGLTAAAVLLGCSQAAAQSGCAAIQTGAVLTAGQWQACFQAKQDALGYTPMNQAGGAFSGRVVTAASTSLTAGFNVPPGTAPGSPVNGDVWTTTVGLFVQVNGVTVGPLGVALTAGAAGCAVGNATGSLAVPTCGTMSALLDQAFSATRGAVITRNATVWLLLAPAGAGSPLISNGTDLAYGSRSGSTTTYLTSSGSLTNGHCAQFDGLGNVVDAGGACGGGGGSGTVSAGTINQIAYYASSGTVVSGLATALSVAVGGTNCSAASGTCLDNISGFGSTGMIARTGAGTYAFRTETGTANHVAVTNGNGVSGNPTYDIASTFIFTGAFGTFTLEANALFIRDQSDTTKRGAFDASVIGTGQTRSYKLPNQNGIIAVAASGGISIDPTTGGLTPDVATSSQIWGATAAKLVDAAGINNAGATQTLTDAATIAVDFSLGVNFTVTLGGNRTLGAPTNPVTGRSGCIYFVQDGTGNRTLAFNAVWKFPGAASQVLSTAAGAVDFLCYYTRDSTHFDSPGLNKNLS